MCGTWDLHLTRERRSQDCRLRGSAPYRQKRLLDESQLQALAEGFGGFPMDKDYCRGCATSIDGWTVSSLCRRNDVDSAVSQLSGATGASRKLVWPLKQSENTSIQL